MHHAWSRVPPIQCTNELVCSVDVICSWNNDFTKPAAWISMIKIWYSLEKLVCLHIFSQLSITNQCFYEVHTAMCMMNWMNHRDSWCSVDWVSCMTCIAELMHARYNLMYGCFIMLLVDWHSVLFALCSFQCSQMAMTADDETEYFVCSDKILIIFKWSAELVKSSFQLHMTMNNSHSFGPHCAHPGCTRDHGFMQLWDSFPDNSPSAAISMMLASMITELKYFVKIAPRKCVGYSSVRVLF